MTDVAQMERVELRCPEYKKLLGAWRVGSLDSNEHAELACRDCRNAHGTNKPVLVLHFFDVNGKCVDTQSIWPK